MAPAVFATPSTPACNICTAPPVIPPTTAATPGTFIPHPSTTYDVWRRLTTTTRPTRITGLAADKTQKTGRDRETRSVRRPRRPSIQDMHRMRPHDVVGGGTVFGDGGLPASSTNGGWGPLARRARLSRHGRDPGIIRLVDDDSAGQIDDGAGHRGGPIRGHERGRFGEFRQRGRTFAVRLRGHGGRAILPGDVVCLGVQPENDVDGGGFLHAGRAHEGGGDTV